MSDRPGSWYPNPSEPAPAWGPPPAGPPAAPLGPTGYGVPFAGGPQGSVPPTLDPVEAITWGLKALRAHIGAWLTIVAVLVVVYVGFTAAMLLLVLGAVRIESVAAVIAFYAIFYGAIFFGGLVIGRGLLHAGVGVLDGRPPQPADLFSVAGLGAYLLTGLLWYLGYAAGLVLCFLPGIAFALLTSLWPYAVIDEGLSGVDALRVTIEATLARIGEVLIFLLACVLFNVAGVLACGVGVLVTGPATFLAMGYAWRVIRGRPIAPLPI